MMTDAWGVVPVTGRGSLPFALVHGESLVAAASFALEAAGVDLLDPTVPVADVRASGRLMVLHDPLCPLTPVEFLVEAVEHCARTGALVAAQRPVTDTVKQDLPGVVAQVGPTVDRSALVEITSPVVLPPAAVESLEEQVLAELVAGPAQDFARLVDRLRAGGPVELLDAPALGRRLHGDDEIAVLEALSAADASG